MILNKEKEKKSRQTKQRATLLALLRETKKHPTAAWLYERMRERFPSVSLGTVYRNLSVLAEQGEVRVLRNGSGFDRFDGDVSRHSHAVCTECGRITDVSDGLPKKSAAEKTAARESGFKILSHRLDFYGICPVCLSAKESAGQDGSR